MEASNALVRDLVRAISARDWDRLDDLVAPGFVRHSRAAGEPGVRSRDELKGFLRRELDTFPDAEERLEDLVAEGSKVAARHSFRGTQLGFLGPHPPTGRVLEAEDLAIYRVDEGQIAEAWVEWDNLHSLEQLGHSAGPPPAPRPGEAVEAWVAAFNRADAAALARLYSPSAVNHQVAEAPVKGRAAIRAMFEREFAAAEMTCLVEHLFEDGEWAVLEWHDPLGLRGCGVFHVVDGQIVFQRGYWDKLSFLRQHGLPIPDR